MATEIKSGATLTSNGNYQVAVQRTGWFRVQVGTKQNKAFGGGNVTVAQDGVIFDNYSGVTVATSLALLLAGGKGVDITLAGATSPDLRVKVQEVRD